MEREYIQRKNLPLGQPGRRRPSGRKKGGPPPILFVALVLIVLIVAVILIVTLSKRGADKPEKDNSSAAVSSDVSSAPVSSAPAPTAAPTTAPTSAPTAKDPTEAPELHDSLISVDGAAYEYYHFSEEEAKRYIDAVVDGAHNLNGATLYNLIVPTSMDVLLSDSYLESNQINSTNQKSAIQWINDSFNTIDPSLKAVPVFDALKSHNGEYIYFRTDRHWTQLGAYYGYEEFCKAKGLTPRPLSEFEKKEYSGYLGSYYETLYDEAMSENPDTVEAYLSSDDTTLTYTDSDGNEVSGWSVIMDGEGYDSSYLYYIFCAANQPYEVIENRSLSDGSACVVVKDSFGNVFIPYLTSHYQYIYAVDYRYYSGSVPQLASDMGATDVIVINTISATSSGELIGDLEDIL